MVTDLIASLVNSRAFTIIVITICLLVVVVFVEYRYRKAVSKTNSAG